MFHEKYKKYNDKIELSPELKAYIGKRLEDAEVAKKGEKSKDYFKTTFWRASAAVLSLVLLVTTIYIGNSGYGSKIPVSHNNVVSVSESSSQTVSATSSMATVTSSKPVVKVIKTQSLTGVEYSAIYESFKQIEEKRKSLGKSKSVSGKKTSFDANPYGDIQSAGSSGSNDFSNTNTQVEGVDEADVVKTDGQYIYSLTNDKVVITSAVKGNLEKVSEISTKNNSSGINKGVADNMLLSSELNTNDMYVSGNRLALIKKEIYYNSAKTVSEWIVVVYLYDITDKKVPKLLKKIGQSGDYISSRLTGGILYLFSHQYFYNDAVKEKPQTFVPSTYSNGKMKTIPAKDICVFGGAIDKEYLVAGSYQLSTGNQISAKSVLGGGDTIYANTANILVAAADYSREYFLVGNAESAEASINKTRLIRLSVKGGVISGEAIGSAPGNLLNQFSMDEYNGYYRLVTTLNGKNNSTSNGVYVLDNKLKTVGKIENLAKGERVYSVRFVGKIGYFVTFRRVDPLFTVDLSNPNAPKVLSAIKIPGFSNYLHPYSDGLLFGLGRNADETTGRTSNMKLSMFDVSYPARVSEKHKISVDSYYSVASYNHKAILINQARDIIGFPGRSDYFIYGYSADKGFYQRARLHFDYSSNNNGSRTRGLFIGDYFYVCETGKITSYSMSNWDLVEGLTFN